MLSNESLNDMSANLSLFFGATVNMAPGWDRMIDFSPVAKPKKPNKMVFSQKMSSDPTMVDHAIIWIFTRTLDMFCFLIVIPFLIGLVFFFFADLTEVATVLVAICLPLVIIASYCAYRLLQQMDAKEAHLAAVKAAQKQIADEASATVKTKGGKVLYNCPVSVSLTVSIYDCSIISFGLISFLSQSKTKSA
jgi:hypothetical protein